MACCHKGSESDIRSCGRVYESVYLPSSKLQGFSGGPRVLPAQIGKGVALLSLTLLQATQGWCRPCWLPALDWTSETSVGGHHWGQLQREVGTRALLQRFWNELAGRTSYNLYLKRDLPCPSCALPHEMLNLEVHLVDLPWCCISRGQGCGGSPADPSPCSPCGGGL